MIGWSWKVMSGEVIGYKPHFPPGGSGAGRGCYGVWRAGGTVCSQCGPAYGIATQARFVHPTQGRWDREPYGGVSVMRPSSSKTFNLKYKYNQGYDPK